jgi:prolyl-tRNA synthetase
VPLRLEVGPREAAAGQATAVDRLGERSTVGPAGLEDGVVARLGAFDAALRKRAADRFHDAFKVAATLEELAGSTHVRVVAWCGDEACGHKIEVAIDGSLLGVPEGGLPLPLPAPGPCVGCTTGRPTVWALAGRPL